MSLRPATVLLAAGLLLVVVAAAIAVINEETVVDYRQATAHHGGEVLDLGHDASPRPGLYGRMVRVVGMPSVVVPPRDTVFDVTADTTRLQRLVQMFQWHEVKVGGRITYEMDWVGHLVDWHRFDQPRGHANPRRMPLHDATFSTDDVRLDGFHLSRPMVHALVGAQPCQPDLSLLPPNLKASFHPYDGHLVTSAHPGDPRLGDLRVSWQCVPMGTITVLGQVEGDRLVPARHADIGNGFDVELGDRSLADILPDVPSPPQIPWVWRITAWLLAWAGAVLIAHGWRRPRHEWLVALVFSVALMLGFTGVTWIGPWWPVGLPLLLGAVLTGAVSAWLMHLRPVERRRRSP